MSTSHLTNKTGTTDHSLSNWTSLKIIFDHIDKVRDQQVNGTLSQSAAGRDEINEDCKFIEVPET